ncbi:outer membrane protein, partial [Zymomonas mobilis]|uniref:outer membrane protein n=1 Tax=Zymomonas mobilis TaxID=542 RepID=UPI0039EB56BF
MRKLAIVAALASSAIAAPALARDGAWYVSVDGGGLFVEDIHYKLPGAQSARMGNKAGYDVDANVGYDFGPFRVEGEAAYKSANNGNFSSGGTTAKSHGSTDVLSFMLNGMFDFGGKNDGVSGFIGGGVGVARVALNHYSLGGTSSFANDSDAHFAWQVIAGIRKPVTKMIDFELKYRFFNVNGLNFQTTDMGNMSGRYRSHSVLAGLVFNFGEPKASPPPPPPPPPPSVFVAGDS